VRCPTCGTEYPDDPDVLFCELDGTALVPDGASVVTAPTATAPVAPEGAVICPPHEDDGEGYCTHCGIKLAPVGAAAATADGVIGVTLALGPAPFLGAVTDRGKRHPTNQDAVTVAVASVGEMPVPVIVLCDGVSSARHSEQSAPEAAQVALERLLRYVHAPTSGLPVTAVSISPLTQTVTDLPLIAPVVSPSDATVPTGALRIATPDAATTMADAIIAAHQAVCALDDAPDATLDPPGCTIVAAVVEPAQITIGWVGDSRAYLLMGDGSRLLTRDHSYVNELIARGELTEEEAAHSQYSHVITLCLGPLNSDAAHPPEPALVQLPRERDGLLVLCSDGLWNYAPQPVFLAKLAREAGPDADAQTIARHLAAFAYDRGGQDNITVAVVRLGDLPPSSPPPSLDTPTESPA